MTRRLLIVGAGGFGRELLQWAIDVTRASDAPDWRIGGFLDANPNALAGHHVDAGIVGDPETYQPAADDVFLCAIGEPTVKTRVADQLCRRGAQFVTLIHPTCIVGSDCHIGEGSILCPYVVLTSNVTLGRLVTLNVRVAVGHDAVVEDGCTLSAFCDVTGNARVGASAFLGSHVVVTPGSKVGSHAKVGAGSVVIHRVAPHTTVMGVPARRICGPGDFNREKPQPLPVGHR